MTASVEKTVSIQFLQAQMVAIVLWLLFFYKYLKIFQDYWNFVTYFYWFQIEDLFGYSSSNDIPHCDIIQTEKQQQNET